MARRVTRRDREAAMDAYAEMLERLHEHDCARLRAFHDDGRARFTTWLVLVARRLAVDWHRHRYGRSRGEEPYGRRAARRRLLDLEPAAIDPVQLASHAEAPDAAVESGERAEMVAAALARLAPRDRMVLALRFEDGASAAEIARLVGLPSPFHVYRRVHALLRGLRAELRARGLEPSA